MSTDANQAVDLDIPANTALATVNGPDTEDRLAQKAFEDGLRSYHGLRADNQRLKQVVHSMQETHKREIDQRDAYVLKLEAAIEEANNQLNKARNDLELYRVKAIEAESHIGTILGHATHAYDRVRS